MKGQRQVSSKVLAIPASGSLTDIVISFETTYTKIAPLKLWRGRLAKAWGLGGEFKHHSRLV